MKKKLLKQFMLVMAASCFSIFMNNNNSNNFVSAGSESQSEVGADNSAAVTLRKFFANNSDKSDGLFRILDGSFKIDDYAYMAAILSESSAGNLSSLSLCFSKFLMNNVVWHSSPSEVENCRLHIQAKDTGWSCWTPDFKLKLDNDGQDDRDEDDEITEREKEKLRKYAYDGAFLGEVNRFYSDVECTNEVNSQWLVKNLLWKKCAIDLYISGKFVKRFDDILVAKFPAILKLIREVPYPHNFFGGYFVCSKWVRDLVFQPSNYWDFKNIHKLEFECCESFLQLEKARHKMQGADDAISQIDDSSNLAKKVETKTKDKDKKEFVPHGKNKKNKKIKR